jgi:hypothetical protein
VRLGLDQLTGRQGTDYGTSEEARDDDPDRRTRVGAMASNDREQKHPRPSPAEADRHDGTEGDERGRHGGHEGLADGAEGEQRDDPAKRGLRMSVGELAKAQPHRNRAAAGGG